MEFKTGLHNTSISVSDCIYDDDIDIEFKDRVTGQRVVLSLTDEDVDDLVEQLLIYSQDKLIKIEKTLNKYCPRQ